MSTINSKTHDGHIEVLASLTRPGDVFIRSIGKGPIPVSADALRRAIDIEAPQESWDDADDEQEDGRASRAEQGWAEANDRNARQAEMLDEAGRDLAEVKQELDDALHDVNAYSSALSRVRAALGLADDASTDDMVERAEGHDRILTAADITDQFVDHVHEGYFWSTDMRMHLDKSTLRHALLDAVKRSQEPYDSKNVRALASVLSDFAVADEHSGSRDDLQLARLLDGRGVRVTTEEN